MRKVSATRWVLLVTGLMLSAVYAQARMSPRQIYRTKGSAVVLIVAAPEGSSSASAGTGSIIRSDGTIITNCHVIYDEKKKGPFPVVSIFLKPETVTGNMDKDLTNAFNAEVIAYDVQLDLALLKIKNPPSNLTVITLGNPDEIGPGDETVAIGHPEQGGLWTITTGVIGTQFENFKGIQGKDVFQMETSLNRGNSGGPLFDIRGYQVGVNTAIARKGEGGVAITGVNFALKSSVVKKWATKYNVQIAYGAENISEDTESRVASAEQPTEKPTENPSVVKTTPPDTKGNTTYKDPESGGSATVEEGYGESEPESTGEQVRRPFNKNAKKKKPIRFESHYRTTPRPYTFGKLFTAVDEVRDRAKKAFDDLDKEIQRHSR